MIAIKKKSLVNKLDDLARREILTTIIVSITTTSLILIMIAIEKKSLVNKLDDMVRCEIIIIINVIISPSSSHKKGSSVDQNPDDHIMIIIMISHCLKVHTLLPTSSLSQQTIFTCGMLIPGTQVIEYS